MFTATLLPAAAEQEKLQAEIAAMNEALEAMTVDAAGVVNQQEMLTQQQQEQQAVLDEARKAKESKGKEVGHSAEPGHLKRYFIH